MKSASIVKETSIECLNVKRKKNENEKAQMAVDEDDEQVLCHIIDDNEKPVQ